MRILSTSIAILVLAGAAIAGGENDKRAVAVINRAIEAMGGDAALAKIEGFRAEYAGTYEMGAMVSPYTSKMVLHASRRLRWDMESPGFEASAAVTGTTSWSKFMAPPARTRGAADRALREWLFHFDLMFLRPLLHSGSVQIDFDLSVETEKGLEETVIVNTSGGDKYTLGFFTPFTEAEKLGKTDLVEMAGGMTLPDGRKGRFEMTLSAPKTFGEVTMPTKYEVRNWVGGKKSETMTEELTSIEWNPEIGDVEFEMPKLTMKLDEPAVKELPEHTALVLVHKGAYEEVGDTFGKARKIVGELGLMPSGPITAVFMTDPSTVSDPAELRTVVRLPVMLMGPPPADLPEGVTLKTLPATKVASITVRGPYQSTTGPNIGKIMAWAGENGHPMAGPPQAAYHHDDELTEPRDQIADVQVPVLSD